MDRIVVAFSNETSQGRIRRLLETEGCAPAVCCSTGGEAIRAVRQLGGAIVICGFKLRDMTASDLAASLWGVGSLLVISSAANLDFCQGENLTKLATPAARSDFFASLDLLRRFEAAHRRPAPPKRRAEDQRLIHRAKELLMDANRMTEDEAHRFLQKRSMNEGLKLAETARRIIDSHAHGPW